MAELVGYHKFYSLRTESFVGSNKISFKKNIGSDLEGETAIRVFTKGVLIFESG
jgi:hypothetical protein